MSAERGGAAQGYGNTPVQNQEMSTKLDWLSYQLPEGQEPWEILPGIMPAWEPSEKPGRYGYRFRIVYMAMEVWLDHAQTTCTRIDLSGRACRDLEVLAHEQRREFDWGTHLAWLLSRGAIIKRLDFAIDLYGPGLDMAYISRAIDRDMYVSRYDDKSINEIKGKKTQGWTIYLGSQESASFMRLYDKVAERLARADEKVNGKWIRLEWQTKAEVAVALGALISTGGMVAATECFNGYFRLKGKGGGIDKKWALALATGATRKLAVIKRGGTVEATEAWIENSVSKSLSALFMRRGDHGYAWLNSIIEAGSNNQSAKHRQMAATPMLGSGTD